MRIFRELHQDGDDPIRRNERQTLSPTKDEGDLFAHRPSPRKIRVLLDVESLPEDTSPAVQLFEALIGHPRVFRLDVEASTITSTEHTVPAPAGLLTVRDTTAVAGDFKYPGAQYSWSINDENPHPDGSTTQAARGSTHPHKQIYETMQTLDRLAAQGHTADFGMDDAVTYAVLAEVTRGAGFDLLISEAPVTAARFLPMHERVVVVSRAEAVPIIAHYLRRQHVFLTGPRLKRTHSRHDYYAEAVHSLAPALRGWEARVTGASGVSSEVTGEVWSRYRTVVSRLARALECRDDIIWSLGSYLTTPVLEDCMDDFDHLLLLLCGAADVVARALHVALGLPRKDARSAKLHDVRWYTAHVEARYGVESAESAAIAELSRLQWDVRVIFELRNSIHNVQIQPALVIGPLLEPDEPRGEAPFGAHITSDIAARIDKIGPEIAKEWGFHPAFAGGSTADLWTLADKAVETTFRFLDLLSLVVLRNPLPEGTTALLSGEVPDAPPRPVPWEGYDDYLPILLGLTVCHPTACLTDGSPGG
ncbi:hypothetical protein [Rhodococcus sp. DMU1]|uniref:hypothetical protein n=1 Tax=Rhodococcus sp. DMU1 TaxID=2722825 RepID=UPI00143E3437|nr:hypothetical protein [Rhodococcus sp. DMU1]QIX54000.1 hypothetical protein HFP48_31235 [Rhodococcus sp. DMU1]